MNEIHKTSLVDPSAQLGNNIKIGPYCIIEKDVCIGDGNTIQPYVQIKSNTVIGKNNDIYQGSILGEIPQDLKYDGEKTSLIIGDNNVIREYCTFNIGTRHSKITKIGNNCLFMAYVHIAHDCIIKDKVILANGVQLGGHVVIDYHATVGGMTPVHQFCNVGQHAFIGGGRVALQDVPPYILATGEPLQYSGINSIGLRRRNFNLETRNIIKKAYKYIYKSRFNTIDALKNIKLNLEQTKEVRVIVDFIKKSERGII